MAPTSSVWKPNALGPKAMRAYGFLVDSPRPIFPRDIRDALCIGRKRAVDLLNDLADHRLAQRPPDGSQGWVAGPLTPSQVSSPSEGATAPQRPSQPQESPSMTDPQCQDCADYGAVRDDCPWCVAEPLPVAQVAPPAATWGWDIRGRPLTGPNGEGDAWRLNGRDLDWVDGRTGLVRKPSVGPGGCPPIVWEAFKRNQR